MDSETFLKGEALSPRDRNVFLIHHWSTVHYKIMFKIKSKFISYCFCWQFFGFTAQEALVSKIFWISKFLVIWYKPPVIIKKQQQQNKQLLSLHFISLCESPLDNFLCVGSGFPVASSCGSLADPKKHKILYEWYKYWRNYNSLHFAVPLVVVETSHRSQHPV